MATESETPKVELPPEGKDDVVITLAEDQLFDDAEETSRTVRGTAPHLSMEMANLQVSPAAETSSAPLHRGSKDCYVL